jgi:1-phosphatidylinositol-4-phosphate 5-kinase
MENVFDIQHGVSIHQRYDIKGSWVDRNAQKVKYGAEATCRHCNMAYRCGTGRDICPNRAGSHEPNVVLKDMDLTTKLRFGREEGQKLLTQLKKDSDFLCDQGIMDYSLLLGVIEVSYQVNPQNILTRDGSVFIQDLMSESQQDIEEIEGMSQNARKNVTRPMKQSRMGLRTSEVVVGPGFYYIGIIDILQTWNISKRMERFTKTFFLRKDPDGISAMPPKPYR